MPRDSAAAARASPGIGWYAVALLLGNSPWMLRLVPSIVGATLVVFVALTARELGGGRGAQMLAAVCTATSLLLLGSNWLFQTVTFDQLWWIASLYVMARLLRTGDARLWVIIGGLLGFGLETKLTIIALGTGLTAALLLTSLRPHLIGDRPEDRGEPSSKMHSTNLMCTRAVNSLCAPLNWVCCQRKMPLHAPTGRSTAVRGK